MKASESVSQSGAAMPLMILEGDLGYTCGYVGKVIFKIVRVMSLF